MGKNWRGGRGGGRGFGGQNTIGSCRGHGIIMGTCDTAREREANKEMINLIDLLIEEMEESGQLQKAESKDASKEGGGGTTGPVSDSIEALMAAEIQQVQNQAHSGTQNAMAVNTGTKGLYIIKLKRSDVDPVVLVRAMFAKIGQEKKSYTRHVCRVVPLAGCFFPNEAELVTNFRKAINDMLPSLSLPPRYINSYEEEDVHVEAEGMTTTDATKQTEDDTSDNKEESKKRDRNESEQQIDKEVSVEESSKKAKIKESTVEATTTEVTATTKDEQEGQDTSQQQSYHPSFTYQILFKRRNHDTLTKNSTMQFIASNMPSPPLAIPTYKNPDVSTATFLYIYNL